MSRQPSSGLTEFQLPSLHTLSGARQGLGFWSVCNPYCPIFPILPVVAIAMSCSSRIVCRNAPERVYPMGSTKPKELDPHDAQVERRRPPQARLLLCDLALSIQRRCVYLCVCLSACAPQPNDLAAPWTLRRGGNALGKASAGGFLFSLETVFDDGEGREIGFNYSTRLPTMGRSFCFF